jgi:hypothetical protein
MMGEFIEEIGRMENNMVKESSTLVRKVFGKRAFGAMENESNGTTLQPNISFFNYI